MTSCSIQYSFGRLQPVVWEQWSIMNKPIVRAPPTTEQTRDDAEQMRRIAEQAREDRERAREAAEAERAEREKSRNTAETARQEISESVRATTDSLDATLNQMKVVEDMRRTLREYGDLKRRRPD